MPETQLRSEQFGPGEVKRSDINIDESSAALITKVIAGTGLQLSSSTGVDSGTGDVTLAIDSHTHSMSDITDVTITSVADNDILAYDSGSALWINQNAAEAGIEPAVNLTINRALISNGSGGLAVSAVTNTELGYVSGVSAAIQTQLDGKSSTSHNHSLDGLSNVTITDIAAGELLKWNGSAWVNNTLSEAGIASDSLATTSAAGIIELATVAETDPGSSTDRAITPDALGGSRFGFKSVCFVPFESDQSVVAGDGKVAFTIGQAMTGMNLVEYVASCHTTGSGTVTMQIRRRRSGSDVDMLSTAITLTNEYYCTDGTINASNDDVQTGDQIYIDIDGVTATAPQGLSITLKFGMP